MVISAIAIINEGKNKHMKIGRNNKEQERRNISTLECKFETVEN